MFVIYFCQKHHTFFSLNSAEIRERDWCNVVTCHMDTAQAYVWRLQNFVLGEHILNPCPENPSPVKVRNSSSLIFFCATYFSSRINLIDVWPNNTKYVAFLYLDIIFLGILTDWWIVTECCFHIVTGLCYKCLWQFCHFRDSWWLD